ncbi:MAG: acyl-CoA dehydrogenase family protein [Rhodospirillales bacterium]|nr:acyl-CoA dehydrogenase family protein [Rhodospirillales bacterium]
MDFNLSEQEQQFTQAVAGFANRHLAAGALGRAHAQGFPFDVARLMAEQGLLGITIPESAGGIGGRLFDAILAIEQIAAVCPRSADVIQAGNFGAIRVLAEFGSARQQEQYLTPLLAGDAVIAIGMTEPEAGSAVTELKTTATADGDGFRINGAKVFTSHVTDAAMILAYVRFGPGTGGIGSVLIESDAEGVSLGQPVGNLGGETWAQLYFNDVYVPAENVVLGAGGFKRQIAGFNVERLGNSARALALGRFAFDIARDHALTRQQFGRPICEFQGLQWKFADMKVELEAARLLLYRAANNADNGFPSAEETAIAKLACNRAGFNAANEAMQVMGAAGYSQDSLVEYCFRRTRGWMIAGGSLEMMKNRIAETVFERRFSQRP